jgi:hypothetical protein
MEWPHEDLKAISQASLEEALKWQSSDSETLYQNIESVPKVEDLTYDEFFSKYLVRNMPVIVGQKLLENWRAFKEWKTEENRINFNHLEEYFGEYEVPVVETDNSQGYFEQRRTTMKFSQFIQYWRDVMSDGDSIDKLLYLKDWHLVKQQQGSKNPYFAYSLPSLFSDDWINFFWDKTDERDDYRFVYMGPKGTWSGFHCDVFGSYSWSSNIIGRKLWFLYPPNQERLFKVSMESDLNTQFSRISMDIMSLMFEPLI